MSLRCAAASTGFRAPTPGQQNTINVQTFQRSTGAQRQRHRPLHLRCGAAPRRRPAPTRDLAQPHGRAGGGHRSVHADRRLLPDRHRRPTGPARLRPVPLRIGWPITAGVAFNVGGVGGPVQIAVHSIITLLSGAGFTGACACGTLVDRSVPAGPGHTPFQGEHVAGGEKIRLLRHLAGTVSPPDRRALHDGEQAGVRAYRMHTDCVATGPVTNSGHGQRRLPCTGSLYSLSS